MSPFPTIVDWTGVSTLGLESDGDGSSNAPYALPDPEQPGSIKMALDRSGPDVDADARSFDLDPERLERLAGWASRRFLPLEEARPPETCLYTNTPTESSSSTGWDRSSWGRHAAGTVSSSPPSSRRSWPTWRRVALGVRLDAFRAGREWTRRHMVDRAFDV